ncbi:hypothetical protein CHS0354_026912 [Potamilus streckersoni]|uniref:Uncharacterized protein n=1 Tax=Potamilus streckersoni TaxID=2493646 RepID=A0AAE0VYT8_9BIVA|nr:hypothetical protein CHS0354_026912 [Potamilus streckersoni]
MIKNPGKFMVANNNIDLWEYYNKLKDNIIQFPHRLEYSSAILSSAKENFKTDSCAYFYYYLNATDLRPNTLSAQLLVYVNGSSGRSLGW